MAAGINLTETSSDGVNWVTHETQFYADNVRFVGGIFICTGHEFSIITSVNGTDWSSHPIGSYEILSDAAFGNGVYVVVGSFGVIFSSRDGVEWSRVSIDYSGFFYAITYASGTFVAVGSADRAVVFTSSDGISLDKTGYRSN